MCFPELSCKSFLVFLCILRSIPVVYELRYECNFRFFFFFPTQILNFISIIYLKICSFLTALQATSVMWQVSVCAGLLGGSLFCFCYSKPSHFILLIQ